MDAPKTKEFMHILEALKAGDRKVLFVLPENSNNIFLSSRNLPEVNVITVDEINTYAIMNANTLVLVDGVQDILADMMRIAFTSSFLNKFGASPRCYLLSGTVFSYVSP